MVVVGIQSFEGSLRAIERRNMIVVRKLAVSLYFFLLGLHVTRTFTLALNAFVPWKCKHDSVVKYEGLVLFPLHKPALSFHRFIYKRLIHKLSANSQLPHSRLLPNPLHLKDSPASPHHSHPLIALIRKNLTE